MTSKSATERRQELLDLYYSLRDCHVCPLAHERTNLVFGSGNADAQLMFVGEAPGFYEDQQAKPFVGRAGQLLDELLAEIGFDRSDAFIANVLKCRPPGNRDPLPDEVAECEPHLFKQIDLIEPRVVCTLGNFSTKLLAGDRRGITKVHGQPRPVVLSQLKVTLYPLHHPAAALRSTAVLSVLREDFARLPGLLEEPPAPADSDSSPADTDSGQKSSATYQDQLGLFG
jgi:uracil-DNA glycosylase